MCSNHLNIRVTIWRKMVGAEGSLARGKGYPLMRAFWGREASQGIFFFVIFVLNKVSILSFFVLIRVSILSIFVLNRYLFLNDKQPTRTIFALNRVRV